MPRSHLVAVIRPACASFGDGFFVQLSLTPREAARLRTHPLLAKLLPRATWVGAGASSA